MKYFLFLLILVNPSFAHEYKLGDLEIDHPYVRATPNGARVAGGFLSITNKGLSDDRLLSGEVLFSERTEVHEMAVVDQIMRMRELKQGLLIKSGQTVDLKPGSYHMMFMGLKQAIVAGENHKGRLVFEKAGVIEIEFKVEAMGHRPMGGSHH